VVKYSDEQFMRNVREARENGFDMVCAECGTSIDTSEGFDSPDSHEMFCERNPEYEENHALAVRYAERKRTGAK
jgi:hypothetical protein